MPAWVVDVGHPIVMVVLLIVILITQRNLSRLRDRVREHEHTISFIERDDDNQWSVINTVGADVRLTRIAVDDLKRLTDAQAGAILDLMGGVIETAAASDDLSDVVEPTSPSP